MCMTSRGDIVIGMDGRAVDRAVREIVRPLLRSVGFSRFTGRKAWRYHEQTIDLVAFRSFSRDSAQRLGCTTFSFALTSGVFYRCLDVALERPDTYHLTFGFEGGKSLRQPWFHHEASPNTWDRPDVWYVLPDGSNLEESVQDARQLLESTGIALMDRFTTPELGYQALLTERSRNPDFGLPGIEMPGAPDSPRWRDTVIAIGHAIGVLDPRQDMRSASVLG